MKSTGQNTQNFLYARFSSAEQSQGNSETDQIKLAKSWCENRHELLSTTYFIDRGVSAKAGKNRDEGSQFHSLMQTVKVGDRVLIRDNDRFSRECVLKALVDLQNIITEKGVTFVILSTGVEVTKENFNNPEVLFPNFFKGFLAHDENEKKKGNILRAFIERREKISNGEVIRKNREGRDIQDVPVWIDSATWTVNSKGAVLNDIFKLYLGGMGPHSISKKLQGTPTLSGKGSWCQSAVHRLLRDRRVLGERQNDGKWVEGYYPATVDKDTFSCVTAKIEQNRGKAPIARGGKDISNLLTGLFQCTCKDENGKAGAIRVSKGHCYCHRALRKLTCANVGSVDYYKLEASFLNILRLKPSGMIQDEKGNGTSAIQILRGQLAETEKQIEVLTKDADEMAKEGMSTMRIQRQIAERDTQVSEFRSRIQLEEAKTVASKGSDERLMEILLNLKNVKTDQAFRAKVQSWIRETVNSVTLDKTTKTFNVDLKTGKVVTMDLAGNILGSKSVEALFGNHNRTPEEALASGEKAAPGFIWTKATMEAAMA